LPEIVGDALSITPELVVTMGAAVQPASTTVRGPSSILASDPVLPFPSVMDDKSAGDSVGEEIPVPTTSRIYKVSAPKQKSSCGRGHAHPTQGEVNGGKKNLESKGISFF
jgi:hypothetical protein